MGLLCASPGVTVVRMEAVNGDADLVRGSRRNQILTLQAVFTNKTEPLI